MQLPGIEDVTAWSLVAEMGPDMAPFKAADELASWACVCPGNHERARDQRAILAVAHSMIVTGFYLIKCGYQYKDSGADFFDRRNREHTARKAVKRLSSLGYKVTLEELPNSQPNYARHMAGSYFQGSGLVSLLREPQ